MGVDSPDDALAVERVAFRPAQKGRLDADDPGDAGPRVVCLRRRPTV